MMTRSSNPAAVLAIAAGALALIVVLAVSTPARAQSTEDKTVAAGVYADAQATRGQQFYESSCVRCHRSDLSGAEGPPLRGERFSKDYGGKDLKVFYDKIANTMPGTAPASLTENVYVDIVAHVLRENGFPAGTSELTRDSLAGIRVLPSRQKPLPPVEDFSYVEAVGCLTSGSGSAWLLTKASDPVSARPEEAAAAASLNKALGSNTFRLLDARAYDATARQGQKVYVRGLLVKMPSETRMTLSALEPVGGSCGS